MNIMESVELKLRLINNSRFVTTHTKHIIDILHEPELAIEVKAGQISDDVSELVESLGYKIVSNRPMDGWNRLMAVKTEDRRLKTEGHSVRHCMSNG
jgi:hypothetical protein